MGKGQQVQAVRRGTCAVEGSGSVISADDGMVAYTGPGWLQTVFDVLKRLFYWVGLRRNVRKNVGMVC